MLLDELGAYLVAQGQGTLGTDLFLGEVPEAPDDVVTLMEYAGLAPQFSHSITTRNDRPRVQVLVRSTTYVAGHLKISDIYGVLCSVVNTTISGVKYRRISPLQAPFLLQRDENDRIIFAFNSQVDKDPS